MAAVVHYCNFADQRVGTTERTCDASGRTEHLRRLQPSGLDDGIHHSSRDNGAYGCRPGGRKSHRDLVADGRPVGARQAFGNKDHIAHRDVIDDAWLKIPATEFVMGFVEKWDELIDWEARTKSERRMAVDSSAVALVGGVA